MNTEIAILINKTLTGSEKAILNVIDVLENCIVCNLTQTHIHEYTETFCDSGLALSNENANVKLIHAALIIRSLRFVEGVDAENILNWLECFVSKWEQVEDNDWFYFANEVYSASYDSADISRYWLVGSKVRCSDFFETDIFTLVYGDAEDSLRIELEVAQFLTSGHFEHEIFISPCFERDGLISYTKSIKEIPETTFTNMKELGINTYLCEQDTLDSDEVVKALDWLEVN